MGYKDKQGHWRLTPWDYQTAAFRRQNRPIWPTIDCTKHAPGRFAIPYDQLQFEYERLTNDLDLYRQRYHNNLQYKYHRAELIPIFRGKHNRPIYNYGDPSVDVDSINYTQHQIRYIRYLAKCCNVCLVG
jgi:hypothetical protein